MEYLVDKESRQIILDAWFDDEERCWLGRGGVCWSAYVFCKEGEEERCGYMVVDIPEEAINPFLSDGYEVLYYIDGKVKMDNSTI